jgi:hypothetical protein
MLIVHRECFWHSQAERKPIALFAGELRPAKAPSEVIGIPSALLRALPERRRQPAQCFHTTSSHLGVQCIPQSRATSSHSGDDGLLRGVNRRFFLLSFPENSQILYDLLGMMMMMMN